jgi:hypothetical protein
MFPNINTMLCAVMLLAPGAASAETVSVLYAGSRV